MVLYNFVVWVNILLCIIYVFSGKVPFFELGLFYNQRFGFVVSTILLFYLIYNSYHQYSLGSITRKRYRLNYFFRSHSILLIIVLIPILLLYLHALWEILNTWWGNILLGFSVIVSCYIYYNEFATYRVGNPAQLGHLFQGIDLPDVEARKGSVKYIELFGINFGTPGTFLAVQWGLACFFHGLGVLIFFLF